MKKIFSLPLFLLSILIVSTNSCKKSDPNPLADFNNLGTGSYITLESTINQNFDFGVAQSEVAITVDQYGKEVDKIDLFVVLGANSDPASWKKIKTIPFTGKGTKIAATQKEVADALEASISDFEAGSIFTFYHRVYTKEGKTYDVSNTPGALESNSNYNVVLRWQAYITCAFTGNMAGSYKVIRDDWEDWTPGDVVTVKDGPGPNQIDLSGVWPNPAYGDIVNPLIIDVNPANGVASIKDPIEFADYGRIAEAYGDEDNNGFVGYAFSCTGEITLTIGLNYGGSDQGKLKLILKKK